MRCTTHHCDPSGRVTQQHHADFAPKQLAALWLAGDAISARHSDRKGKGGKPKFGGADFIACLIDLRRLPLAIMLETGFTERYCSVAVFPDESAVEGFCMLAFKLPRVEIDARQYELLLAGLETIYRGALTHGSVMQPYGIGGIGRSKVAHRVLDESALRDLKRLGKETRKIGGDPDIFLRSAVELDPDDVIMISGACGMIPDSVIAHDDGHGEVLERLHPGTRVFCPVHSDSRVTAEVCRLTDGRPAVQCDHCQRTYAVPQAGLRYDFGQFERVLRDANTPALRTVRDDLVEWDVQDQALPVNFYRERYLPASALTLRATSTTFKTRTLYHDKGTGRYLGTNWPEAPEILCVKSPKGSGKTERLRDLVNACKERGHSVLSLGHRIALQRSLADRLGLDFYLNGAGGRRRVDQADVIDDELSGAYRMEPTKYFATCLDSVIHLDFAKCNYYNVIIIDEAEQVFRHLVGDTIKDRRADVYTRLRGYLQLADCVVLLDADLGMVTVQAILAMKFRHNIDIRFVVNDGCQEGGEIKLYPTRGELVERLCDAVAAGDKCFVATNCKTKAIELQKVLNAQNPDRRIVCVHSGNSGRADIQAVLRNIAHELEHGIDVLIASPSLGTGIDLSFKDSEGMPRTVVKHVFGLFAGDITTHTDIDQQLARVRQPGNVHVWIDPEELTYETDPGVIKRYLERTVGATHVMLGRDDDDVHGAANDYALLDIFGEVKAAQNGSKNRLAELFNEHRMTNGWNLALVEHNYDAAMAGKDALGWGREQRLDERSARILAAPQIDAATAKKLKGRDRQGRGLSDGQQAELDRHRIERFYRENVSDTLIDFDAEGRTRKAIGNLECLMLPMERQRERDFAQYEKRMHAIDLGLCMVKRQLLGDMLAAAGLFDRRRRQFNASAQVERRTLSGFVVEFERRREEIESVFDVTMRRDAHANPVQQVGDFLRLIGLKLCTRQTQDKNGRKVRRYGLDADRLTCMLEIVERRDGKRWREIVGRMAEEQLEACSAQWEHEQDDGPVPANATATPGRGELGGMGLKATT